MNSLFKLPMTRAWLALFAATLTVAVLVENDAPARSATIAIILIAAFKLRLVFLHFMELSSGAMPWRLVAEIWVAVVTAVILGGYLITAL
ncbi:MAG: cytochrome C oxidase subunit IV family protein [Gammaproteobacteria bacterium]|jgi:heme/copper-type cytochrome/quinol oxidase subunit 4|nr:cytochrome C oxidase subunit IV family protein [Gammaproteobacteria bacterium]